MEQSTVLLWSCRRVLLTVSAEDILHGLEQVKWLIYLRTRVLPVKTLFQKQGVRSSQTTVLIYWGNLVGVEKNPNCLKKKLQGRYNPPKIFTACQSGVLKIPSPFPSLRVRKQGWGCLSPCLTRGFGGGFQNAWLEQNFKKASLWCDEKPQQHPSWEIHRVILEWS